MTSAGMTKTAAVAKKPDCPHDLPRFLTEFRFGEIDLILEELRDLRKRVAEEV